LIGVCAVAFLGMRAQESRPRVDEEVRARRFVVVDAENGIRGQWTTKDGTSQFSIGGGEDVTLDMLSNSKSATITLGRKNEGIRLESSAQYREANLCLAGGEGSPAIEFQAHPSGAQETIKESNGGTLTLGLSIGAGPSVRLSDEKGLRAVLGSQRMAGPKGVESRPVSSLLLFARDGAIVEQLPR
jgi:hypothetical protein